jgi:hypothetical protein
VHKPVGTELFERRGAPSRVELRRLRNGVFRLGSRVGLDTQAVVRFSEAVTGRRWRRCGIAEMERVVADFAQIANRIAASPERTSATRAPGGREF